MKCRACARSAAARTCAVPFAIDGSKHRRVMRNDDRREMVTMVDVVARSAHDEGSRISPSHSSQPQLLESLLLRSPRKHEARTRSPPAAGARPGAIPKSCAPVTKIVCALTSTSLTPLYGAALAGDRLPVATESSRLRIPNHDPLAEQSVVARRERARQRHDA